MQKTIPDHFRALALDKQKLTGLLGSRIRANREGFLENLNPQDLLRPLTTGGNNPDSAERTFAGQFLDAAADAYEHNHDVQLRSQMEKVAAGLNSYMRAQMPSSPEEVSAAKLVATRSDLLGLLAYFRVSNDTSAYATAQAVATNLMKLLSEDTAPESNTIAANHTAQLGLLDPLLDLYRMSRDRNYLDFCLRLARGSQLPEVTSATPAAALLLSMDALGGLANLYEVSGDASFLPPPVAAWKHIASNRLSVTGAPTEAGQDQKPIDACLSAAWLQFTFRLLRVTGESSYGDQLERSVYNQILAGQEGHTGNLSPAVPLNGEKRFQSRLNASTGAGLLAEAKALALLPRLVWGRYESGIAINLYTPGRAFFTLRKHGMIRIYSEGSFPENGHMQLHIEPSAKSAHFPLRLRVPRWTHAFTVQVAGIELHGVPGDVVIVDRDWKSGDSVSVDIELPLQVLPASGKTSGEIFLQRGPQILALGKTLNPDLQDLTAAVVRPAKPEAYQIFESDEKVPLNFGGDQVYRINGELGGHPRDFLLIPFADALAYRTALRTRTN